MVEVLRLQLKWEVQKQNVAADVCVFGSPSTQTKVQNPLIHETLHANRMNAGDNKEYISREKAFEVLFLKLTCLVSQALINLNLNF